MQNNLENGLRADEMFQREDMDSVVYRMLKVVSTVICLPLSGTVNVINYLKNWVWNSLLRERWSNPKGLRADQRHKLTIIWVHC